MNATCCVAFSGYSGSGKTRLVRRLIERFAAQGLRVGAIKHTHHTIDDLWRGDTQRFLDSGASEVVLAASMETAVMTRLPFEPPPGGWRVDEAPSPAGVKAWRGPSASSEAVAALLRSDIVFIEGFRSEPRWARVAVVRGAVMEREGSRTIEELSAAILSDPSLVAIVTDVALNTSLPQFDPEDIAGIAGFVDRICR